MILNIIRHGEPDYTGSEHLTDAGVCQANAVAKVMKEANIDEVYASPLVRAQLTAQYTAELLGKSVQTVDFLSENIATRYFLQTAADGKAHWMFEAESKDKLIRPSVVDMGMKWYDAPEFADPKFKQGYFELLDASDSFFEKLGYLHDRENHCYKIIRENEKKIAAFCHGGIASGWLPVMLDIPLPTFWRTMNVMNYTAYTTVHFEKINEEICVPRILTLNNYSHISEF